MTQHLVDRARDLIHSQKFDDALPLLRKAIEQDPLRWAAWYMAGQCCRFMDDIDGAIQYLNHAAKLNERDPGTLLALGIAFQLDSQWDKAVKTLIKAIELDFDYAVAYNSLALTQRKRGEYDKALYNYDLGLKALSRTILKTMRNDRMSPIIKLRETTETKNSLWLEYAMYGAMSIISATEENISGVAWPTGEQALEEERNEKHEGLYWVDNLDNKEEIIRMFLPNYFNAFCVKLRAEGLYSNLIGNTGRVLELLERYDEANRYFEEASEFSL